MSLTVPYLFNLLLNSVISFAIGFGFIGFSRWLFRIPSGKWKLFLLSVPFLKILWDVAGGIPADSWLSNPLVTPIVNFQQKYLTVSFGFSYWHPIFQISLAGKDGAGNLFSLSAADYFQIWLSKAVNPDFPFFVVLVITAGSLFFTVRRVFFIVKFNGGQYVRSEAPGYGTLSLMGSEEGVRIYRSNTGGGTPFTGGYFHPYICFPDGTWKRFTRGEREAVIRHEIAHIRHYDLWIATSIQLLGDLFWFVPGYRFLEGLLEDERELLADRKAVELGADPQGLASALLKLKKMPVSGGAVASLSSFVKRRSMLQTRISRLMDIDTLNQSKGRWGWSNRFLRPVIALWLFSGALVCTIGGNHKVEKIPAWAQSIYGKLGWKAASD